MPIQIFNSLSHKKEEFVPQTPGEVKLYLCGPTVYGLLHIGNFRGPIFFNLVRNWFEKRGFNVRFAFNFTDVDDKIINRANQDGMTSEEVAEKYIAEFKKDFAALGLRPHTYNPKVTETMGPIIDLVSDLVKKEKAYVAQDGEVLYSVKSFDGYGKLSRKNIDDLQAGARVEVDPKKRDPMDFALWKPAKPGEPKWSSPWCEGRPGWHIECSAMVQNIFGESVDIHGGGSDLIFPHHENEIAQSEGSTGKQFAKYWMHNAMLTFGEKKMSKSLGNIISAREFMEKYDAEILKFMMLSVHYRSLADASESAISSAIAGLAKIYSSMAQARAMLAKAAVNGVAATKPQPAFAETLKTSKDHVERALDDDFNTAEAFAAVYAVIKGFNSLLRPGQKVTPELAASAQGFLDWMKELGALMALFEQEPANYLRSLDDRMLAEKGVARADVDKLIAERTAVRGAKDFKRSDELRDQLMKMGIAVQDGPEGTSWEVAKG